MTFTGGDIVRISITLYVLTWAGFVCFLNLYSGRKNTNVHKVAKWYFITVATRHWGWLPALFMSLLLFWTLPDIYVVTQDVERKKADIEEDNRRWKWYQDTTYTLKETFYVDKYYVPFSFHGNKCAPFNSYLINESDSILVIYSTNLFNGQFTKVSSIAEFEIIPPGHFQKFDRHIHNQFDSPNESSFSYIPEDRKNKSTTELTITLMSDAIYETRRIQDKINDRNEMMYGIDSLGISLTAREFLLKQLKKSQDAKQGTH